MKILAAIGFMLVLVITTAIIVTHNPARKESSMQQASKFQLNSIAFGENGVIPDKYTCKGENISPPLEISGVPAGTESMTLILHDPDAPSGDWLHWSVWNIAPDTKTVAENAVPTGSVQGKTSFGDSKYGGPCPPSGTHHYEFDLYALDSTLKLPAGSTRAQLQQAMQTKIIAQTKLVGLYAVN